MSIKDFFNHKDQMDELDKQKLRINALEVHIKRLLKFEEQFRTYTYESSRAEKRKERKRGQTDGSNIENLSLQQELNGQNKKLDDISRRLNRLETAAQDLAASQIIRSPQPSSKVEPLLKEERIRHIVEQLLADRLAAHSRKEEKLQRKIQTLENQVSKLMEREKSHSQLWGDGHVEKSDQAEEVKAIHPLFSRENGRSDEESDDSFHGSIHMRLLVLEKNYLLVNEVQAGMLKQMDQLMEKWNQLHHSEEDVENSSIKQEPLSKTIYIDKLYLDKYEQNNNFAQLGIKNLSGALNIGATYGKDAVPKEVTEHLKEEIANMKGLKEEMANQQPHADANEDTQDDESSSDINADLFEEEDGSYIDIEIADDHD
ncbi:hypothetical protein [Bacillus benzoevorans]|uniref:Archaellum component FlaC n=1 Tax=Bacillus benzoevorans TaxID=1456 RepID=A0A7X0HUE9_9BACI|nr:hypothetical protein [Bacillus benzoevorans]MBB6447075.1 archaellum component FlaC [Bacillus benzoevorans]